MTAPVQIQAFWALRKAVANSPDPSEPAGGTAVVIRWDDSLRMFEVESESESSRIYAAAPTLEQALLALDYLDAGDSVVVSHTGRALCVECGGAGCETCRHSGESASPPRRWPVEGTVV